MAEKKIKAKTSGKAAGTKAAKSTKTKPVKKASGAKVAPKSAKKKTTFTLRAPEATGVFVAGCFNDWDSTANPLERDEEGIWTCTLLLEPGEHEYRFIVDDVWWDDPLNLMRRQTEFGCENCILIM
jgi:1,4-alpha-glucan branching enzyme